jgi:predicted lipoprotein with Yx(FWY)xxD motif
MVDGGNTLLFPAYTYSKGTGCTKACAAAWPPVIAQGRAGLLAGVASRDVGTVRRAGGARQLTWKGKALYFFGDEGISSKFTVEGNGNGRTADGGTFRLVTA